MSRALVIINRDSDREKAAHWAMIAPVGTRVEYKAPRRSLPQNDMMWSLLTDVAGQVVWHGAKLSAEDWKLIFMQALNREVRAVLGIDGRSFVNIGVRSSDLSKDEMSDMIELILKFGAEHGVTFSGDQNSEAAPSLPASSVSANAGPSRHADQAAPANTSQQAGAALTIGQKVAIAKGLLWPAQAAVSANDPSGEAVINDAAKALQNEHGDGAKPFLVAVFRRAIAVVRGEQEIEEVRELIASQIGCEPEELMETT